MDAIDSTAGPSDRWGRIGSGPAPRVELVAVELWMLELPFRTPVATAKGEHRTRPLVMVQVVGRRGSTEVIGWGECAALADTTYDAEDAAGSFEVLGRDLVPALFARTAAARGALPGPAALGAVRSAASSAPLAFAALEMAVADAHLRAGDRSFAALVGVEGRTVELGAVVGRVDSVDDLLARVAALADQGYGRVKVKTGPGWDVVPLAALTEAFPELRFQADANGSYGDQDDAVWFELDRFGLLCIEQPFDRADLAAHARLASRLVTPICLDESLDSPAAVRHALDAGCCSVVCVKPSRLGGIGAALTVVESCTARGVPLWMGGMFESGYARGVNAALAALPGFSWPGDLSPSGTYLDDDLVTPAPPQVRDGRLVVTIPPDGGPPGMGPPPEPDALDRRVQRRRRLEPDRA
ncbi:MAG: o-succinylbenzoate synthase [Acidimicrobiales bacterium]